MDGLGGNLESKLEGKLEDRFEDKFEDKFAFSRQCGEKSLTLAERLVAGIAVGTFSPGQALPPERELAESLGVSRQTLRQALRRVASMGLIETRRGRGGGTFIAETGWDAIPAEVARQVLDHELPKLADLVDYRCLVERLVAETAARRRTDDDVAGLREALAAFKRAAGDMIEARSVDRRLHGLVVAAARNPHLVALSAHLRVAVTLGFGAEPYPKELFARADDGHESLVAAVIAGDVAAAGDAAEEHFRLATEAMELALNRAINPTS